MYTSIDSRDGGSRSSPLAQPLYQALACVGTFFCVANVVSGSEPKLDQALVDQSRYGSVEAVKDLLQQGADPNSRRTGGQTALHVAAGGGRLDVMRLLIEAGADVDAKSASGQTVLTAAVNSRGTDAVELLLNSDATPSGDALGLAAWLNNTEAVKLFLAAGVPADAGLPRAAHGGHVELVQLLLDEGADPNAGAKPTSTPLHLAALQGGLPTVSLLLERGADPNALDKQQETPLHKAISGDAENRIVERLVGAGARMDIANHDGVTPVRLASIRGAGEIYAWLVQSNGGKEPTPHSAGGMRSEADSLAALIADASSKDHQRRQAARRELVLRGEEAVPVIVQAINSGTSINPFYELFSNIGPDAERALPLLQSKLTEKEHVCAALMTINRMKPGAIDTLSDENKQAAAKTLEEVVSDPTLDVMASFACSMVIRLGEPALDTLLRLLQHERAEVRKQTVEHLRHSQLNDQRVDNAVVKTVQADPSIEVRAVAATTLAALGRHEQAAQEAMMAIVKQSPPHSTITTTEQGREAAERHQRGVDAAARALGAFGGDAVDDLIPLLSPMERPQRSTAIKALVSIGKPAVPRLIELLKHEDNALAVSASVALNRIGTPAVPALVQAVATGNEQVIVHGGSALWWIGAGAEEALPVLLDIAGSEKQPDAARLAAIRAALKIGPDVAGKSAIVSSIPVLIRLLDRGSLREQLQAADALGTIGPPARDALPLLHERAKPSNDDRDNQNLGRGYVRSKAKEAITAIESHSRSALQTP